MSAPPVVPGRLYGLRRWAVSWDAARPMLGGWAQGGDWQPDGRPTRARCLEHRSPLHRAPAAGCGCGLYGLHPHLSTAREMRRSAGDDSTAVVGIVEAWGRVELHRSGFRAELARPHALVLFTGLPDPAHEARTRAVAKAHGIPVLRVTGAAALHRHCAEHGLGMNAETVGKLLPGRDHGAPAASRGRRVVDALGVAVAGLGVAAYAAMWIGGIGAGLLIATDLLDGPDGPAATVGPNRHLEVLEQAVVPYDDGGATYVVRVRNSHPSHTALGVFPRGSFLDAEGLDAGGPEDRFDVDFRPTLGPGRTGVVVDYQDYAPAASAVAGFDTELRARGFERASPHVTVRAGRVRFDRARCLLTTTLASSVALADVEVAVVGRDRRGSIQGAAVYDVGPVRAGRSQQVLERVPPGFCRHGRLRFEAYPNLRPGQLRP